MLSLESYSYFIYQESDKYFKFFCFRNFLATSLKYSIATVFSIYVFFGSLMCISKDFRNAVLFLHIGNIIDRILYIYPSATDFLKNSKKLVVCGKLKIIRIYFYFVVRSFLTQTTKFMILFACCIDCITSYRGKILG